MPDEMKWTPGPWRISAFELRAGSETRWIMAADDFSVACVESRDGEENDANAHLIAAAPELYAALEAIDRYWAEGNFSRQPGLWNPMRAALAKARGEQPRSTAKTGNAGNARALGDEEVGDAR